TRQNILPSDPGGQEALAFVKRVLDRGVPKQALQYFIAKVTRPIGNGSEADRIQRMNLIKEYIGEMPEEKRRQFVRDAISYVGGSRELANRYGPDVEPQGPTVHAKLAMFENASLAQGADPASFFSPDDPHATHFPIHRDYLVELMQSDADPQQVAVAVQSFGPHMSAHLKGMEGDPTRKIELQQYKQEFAEIMKMADQIMEAA